nr:TrkA C-terminal domain-containing protein [Bacteroidota bacterium]
SNATVIGKSLLEIGFAKNYKISLLAISRGQQTISNPKNDLLLMENDILFFLGSNEKILEVTPLFRPGDGECVVGED